MKHLLIYPNTPSLLAFHFSIYSHMNTGIDSNLRPQRSFDGNQIKVIIYVYLDSSAVFHYMTMCSLSPACCYWTVKKKNKSNKAPNHKG